MDPQFKGYWSSTYYSNFFAKGDVVIFSNKTLDINDLSSADGTEIEVYIKYTGIYLFSTEKRFKTFLKCDGNKISMEIKYGEGLLRYNLESNGQELVGTYELHQPIDRGTVFLRKYDPTEAAGCICF